VVVLGVGAHLARAGTGFERPERERLRGLLTALLGRLAGRGVLAGSPLLIGNARVPIIKCRLAGARGGGGGGGSGGRSVAVDISLGVANGAAAVAWVAGAAAAVPALRPLVLVVKALLKQWRLNEVFKGGLSSCAPVSSCPQLLSAGARDAAHSTSGAVHCRTGINSAWAGPVAGLRAHMCTDAAASAWGQLQERAWLLERPCQRARSAAAPSMLPGHRHGDRAPRPSCAPGARRYSAALLALAHLQAERAAPAWPVLPGPAGSGGGGGRGGGQVDLGHALVGFLERFGRQFDYERQAVRRDVPCAIAGRVWTALRPSARTSVRAHSATRPPLNPLMPEGATCRV